MQKTNMSDPKKKFIFSVLPANVPKNVPSLLPFYKTLPPLPKVESPLAELFIALDRRLTYPGPPSNVRNWLIEIENILDNHFTIRKTIEAGSASVGTGIANHCDFDVLVCLRFNSVDPDSGVWLSNVYNCLRSHFGSRVDLQTPAVVIRFGDGPDDIIDVVPIFNDHDPDQYTDYPGYTPEVENLYLPGFSGDWIPTNPYHHSNLIHRLDEEQNGRVRRLIRLLKLWKYNNTIPIISYYLESFVVHLAREDAFDEPPQVSFFKTINCIKYIFGLPNVSIVDPNIYADWGTIVPCRREEFPMIEKQVYNTAFLATNAMDAEWRGNIEGAAHIWNSVFRFKRGQKAI